MPRTLFGFLFTQETLLFAGKNILTQFMPKAEILPGRYAYLNSTKEEMREHHRRAGLNRWKNKYGNAKTDKQSNVSTREQETR